MSWAGPDREWGPPANPLSKPLCTTRPSSSQEDWPQVAQYLQDRSLCSYTANANGWFPSRTAGDEELRVVIPCLSADLTNRYWQARLLRESKEKFPLRYTSPHHVRRGDALAVVYPVDDVTRGTVLVEGPMDALAAAGEGFVGIAWMGTSPGDEPIQFAHRLVSPPVYVVADSDAVQAAVKIWQNFVGAFMVSVYPHKDLASVPKTERYNYFRR